MGPLEAVVFDMDGVLLDSEGIWDEVRRGLAAEAGRPWPDDATQAMMGMNTAEWSRFLAERIRIPQPPEAIADAVIDRMAARYERSLPLLPGAVQAVERMADFVPLGLASSSPRRLIDAALAAAGIARKFTATVATDGVGEGKPSPAVYLRAVELLGVDASGTVAVEDSSNGLRSAAAAGLIVIAIPPPGYAPAPDALARAALQLPDLDELTPGVVQALATQARS